MTLVCCLDSGGKQQERGQEYEPKVGHECGRELERASAKARPTMSALLNMECLVAD